jgi:hypothetical protein
MGWGVDPKTNAPLGLGYCLGGCASSDDCPAGSQCAVETGLCVTEAPAQSLSLGDSCDPGAQSPGCNCFGSAQRHAGYCVQFCVTGSSRTPCPAGTTCDSGEIRSAGGATSVDGAATLVSKQNVGLAGSCLPTCALADDDSGAGMDATALLQDGATADSTIMGDATSDGLLGDAESDTSASQSADDAAGSADAASADAASEAENVDATPPDAAALDGFAQGARCPPQSSCRSDTVAGPDCLP